MRYIFAVGGCSISVRYISAVGECSVKPSLLGFRTLTPLCKLDCALGELFGFNLTSEGRDWGLGLGLCEEQIHAACGDSWIQMGWGEEAAAKEQEERCIAEAQVPEKTARESGLGL